MKSNFLCKDCKHCFISIRNQILFAFYETEFRYSCRKAYEEQHINYNPVTGGKREKGKYKLCTTSRSDEKLCGADAKYWAPKHKKDLFRILLK
jgi:hypothetical protein